MDLTRTASNRGLLSQEGSFTQPALHTSVPLNLDTSRLFIRWLKASGYIISILDSVEVSKWYRHLHLFSGVYNDKLFGVVGCEA